MHVTAIIAAGGRGQRFGGRLLKQLVTVGGRSVLERSVTLFVTHPEIDEVIVTLPAELVTDLPVCLRGGSKAVSVVTGGNRRQDSVTNGFNAASDRTDVIVIHDAARPFATASLVSRTIAAAVESGAAVAALAAQDTVKRGGPFVLETLAREQIYLAQTPQAFRRDVLRDALALATTGVEVTDEATLAERAGHSVRIVEGERTNMKITTPEDLLMAEAIAGSVAPAGGIHVGTGYDLHRLVGIALRLRRGEVARKHPPQSLRRVVEIFLDDAEQTRLVQHLREKVGEAQRRVDVVPGQQRAEIRQVAVDACRADAQLEEVRLRHSHRMRSSADAPPHSVRPVVQRFLKYFCTAAE